MGSDFLVSHKAPNVGHYQSGGDGRREKDREEKDRERQFLPKGLVQLSPGLVILKGRGSCRLIFSHP